jgi:hypothetical protein
LTFGRISEATKKIDLVSLKNKKNEAFGKGLMSEITDSWDNEIFEFLGFNKKYHWHHKHSILLYVNNGRCIPASLAMAEDCTGT